LKIVATWALHTVYTDDECTYLEKVTDPCVNDVAKAGSILVEVELRVKCYYFVLYVCTDFEERDYIAFLLYLWINYLA